MFHCQQLFPVSSQSTCCNYLMIIRAALCTEFGLADALCQLFFFFNTMTPALINFFFRYIISPWVLVKSWMETGWLSHYITSDSERTWRRKLCASSLLQRHRYLFTHGLYSLILTLQIPSVWCVKLKYLGLKVDWSYKVWILFFNRKCKKDYGNTITQNCPFHNVGIGPKLNLEFNQQSVLE